MKIILDAMGGDNAPQAPVLGALEAVKLYGTQITLVGRGEEILQVLKEKGILSGMPAVCATIAPVVQVAPLMWLQPPTSSLWEKFRFSCARSYSSGITFSSSAPPSSVEK